MRRPHAGEVWIEIGLVRYFPFTLELAHMKLYYRAVGLTVGIAATMCLPADAAAATPLLSRQLRGGTISGCAMGMTAGCRGFRPHWRLHSHAVVGNARHAGGPFPRIPR